MRRSSLFVPLTLAAFSAALLPRTAEAQECTGLPAQARGVFTYGLEGTDGATGSGLTFAYQRAKSAITFEHQSLDGFTMVDRMRTSSLQASRRVSKGGAPVCMLGGLEWTSYSNDRDESTNWSADDPGYRTERIRLGGGYRRLRIPVGVAVGRAFDIGGRFLIIPHAAGLLVLEHERYEPSHEFNAIPRPAESRTTPGIGASGGVTVATSWLVISSTLGHAFNNDRALSSRNNFPTISLHVGVRF